MFLNIPPLNRAKLLDDAFFFYKLKKMDEKLLLRLLAYMKNEVDLIPWISADKILKFLHKTEDEIKLKVSYFLQ